ncbi:MAG: VWA domain-containing protein [Gordonia sp. (in: high G+C Gram-positive bacteria)]|uniref:VWA domain-containing protein n=1 Tax=Gordonia sp. (in: high G+C Gram-positive bacteria) TaxID=84139 RepID=UPI0039E63D1F
MIRRLVLVLTATALLIAGVPPLPRTAGPAYAEPGVSGPGTTLVVMDTSGSMSASTEGGKTRIDEAKEAVVKTAESLPDGAQFGLIAYPGDGRTENGCSIGDEEIRLGPVDAGAVATAVRRLTPNGSTPTGPALEHAARILKGAGGHGTIIVVSDGDANCGSSNLCEVARRISNEGMAVQAHTVGFHHDDDQLECVASTLGGKHVNVTESGALEPVLEELSGARLEFTLEVPKEFPEVAGVGTQGTTLTAKVKSTGQQSANNVRVSIDVRDADGRPSARLLVPNATRFLGNMEPDREREVLMTIRPPEGTVGDYSVTATAYSVNTSPIQQKGSFKVVRSGPIAGILGETKTLAVLGDSFSSGEGARPFIKGTDNKRNRCHRSAVNYGNILFPNRTITIACSGAVIHDFYGQQRSSEDDAEDNYEQPQLKRLRGIAADIDAVTLSIGGNDLRFAEIVKECADPINFNTARCATLLTGAEAIAATKAFSELLTRTYLHVDRAVNDEEITKKRGGRQAPVLIVPYPRLTPTEEQLKGGKTQRKDGSLCFGSSDAAVMSDFNRLTDAVNRAADRAVTAAQKLGRPVYFAQPVIESFQPDHTICDEESYVNRNIIPKLLPFRQISELVHPNAGGHAAMASAIRAWSRLAAPVAPSGHRPVTFESWDQIEKEFEEPNIVDDLSGTVTRSFNKTPMESRTLIESMGLFQQRLDGYLPNSVATIEVRSTPQVVQTARTDGRGRITVRFRIPTNLQPGEHTVTVKGTAADGNPKEVTTAIRVLPRYSGIMAVVFLLGIVLASGGAIAIRRARRKARQAKAAA